MCKDHHGKKVTNILQAKHVQIRHRVKKNKDPTSPLFNSRGDPI